MTSRSGRVEIVRHESRLLADNPLGDPSTRDLGIYLPPSYDAEATRRFPVVLFLPGFTGTGLALLNRQAWGLALDQRLDRLFASGGDQEASGRGAHEAIVILPDCFTRYGGSQYVDSPAIGRYQSYLCDEVVPFVDQRYRTLPVRESRAVIGKSSGGYGAILLGLNRPDLFGALASHAGDSAFDLCYLKELGHTLLALEKRGGLAGYLRWFDEQPTKPGASIEVMSNLCCAAAWSPSERGPYGYGIGFDLPMDLRTGALIPSVWARWLAADPVRLFDEPRHVQTLRSFRKIYLDAGLSDEFYLQLGARQLSAKLHAAGIAHVHEEFEGGHMNTPYRYDRSFEIVTAALARG